MIHGDGFVALVPPFCGEHLIRKALRGHFDERGNIYDAPSEFAAEAAGGHLLPTSVSLLQSIPDHTQLFGVIRDPCQWYVRAFSFAKSRAWAGPRWPIWGCLEKDKSPTFEQFVEWVTRKQSGYYSRLLRTQIGPYSSRRVSFLCRADHLIYDLPKALAMVDAPGYVQVRKDYAGNYGPLNEIEEEEYFPVEDVEWTNDLISEISFTESEAMSRYCEQA